MKLHSPRFEKQLRRGVKTAIRASPALKREYRRAKKFRKREELAWFFRGLFSLVFGIGVFAITRATSHPATGLAAISLWTFAWIFFLAQHLSTALHEHSDIPTLRLLPVPEATIFQWVLRKFLRRTSRSLLDLVVGFGVLGLMLDLSASRWLALPFIALVAWLALLALAALCVIYVPRTVYQIVATGFLLSGFLLLFTSSLFGRGFADFLDRAAPELNLLLPTGWAVSLFQLLLPEGQWYALLLIPVALVVGSLNHSLNRLRNDFRYEEHIVPVAPDLVPNLDELDWEDDVSEAQASQHQGLTAIEEFVRSRQFLSPVLWHQRGWFEQRLWNWLNAREKSLCEFTFPLGYDITAPWLKALRNLVIAVALALAAGLVSPAFQIWVAGAGLLIVGSQVLGQIGNNGVGIRSIFCNGVNIPIYAAFGIGYLEYSRLLIKCTVVQIPLFVPLVTACGTFAAVLWHLPWQTGIAIGLKIGILLFGARFILISLGFSGGTNDSTPLRMRTLTLIASMLGLGAVFLGLAGASFLVRTPTAWVFPGLAVLDAYVLFKVYGWFYHTNRFDLMNVPRE